MFGPESAGCLIFDWDGTLVDSTAANYRALADALERYGIALDERWYRAHTGMSSDEMVGVLAAEQGRGDRLDLRAVAAERDAVFLRGLDAVRELTPVADIVRAFAGTVPLVVASGGSGPVIRATLTALGWNDLFHTVVTREDVAAGKPDPAIFRLAAERAGVPPAACLVYEDSDEGLLAAERAGMPAIDVRPWRHGPKANPSPAQPPHAATRSGP